MAGWAAMAADAAAETENREERASILAAPAAGNGNHSRCSRCLKCSSLDTRILGLRHRSRHHSRTCKSLRSMPPQVRRPIPHQRRH